MALISSNEDEKKIARKLIKWFISLPALIEEGYLLDRNVFHLLVLKNKIQVLSLLLKDTTWKILQNKSWHEIAISPDRTGCTLFHYAARDDESSLETMDVLFHYFPDKINIQNKQGNTPLHVAVIERKLWAVKYLVAKKCNRSIKNINDKTPLDLSEMGSDLRQALLSIDLSVIKSLDLRHREKSTETINSFRDSFPLLSSDRSDYSSSPSSSLESLHSSLRFHDSISSEHSSSDLDLEEEKDWNEDQTIENDIVIVQLQQLIKAYQTNKRSVIYASLQKEFNAQCLNNLLFKHWDITEHQLFQTPENRTVLSEVISILYPSVDNHYTQIQNKTHQLIAHFIRLLAPHISIADSEPRIVPRINKGQEQTDIIRDTLWLITACQVSHESKREFSFEDITNRALGILSSFSLFEVLINLRGIYPHFDKDQKIVANFIVFQLLNYNAIDQVKAFSKLDMQLRFFCNLNVDKKIGLGELGEFINRHLMDMQTLVSSSNHPMLQNFSTLNHQTSRPEIIKSNKSFDEIVEQALSKTRDTRIDEVLIIAHDLRMLTVTFYQQVSIKEFHNLNWGRSNKETLSPHVVEFTEFYNGISNYFMAKILLQPSGNIKNALQLLIEIAQALCSLDGEQYPDLNHLMGIGSSVLDSPNITRLTSVLKELPQKDKLYMEEISQVVSTGKNFKVMRELYHVYRTTLPFLGLLLKDITFAHDGNSSKILKAEATGAILKRLMEIKVLINFERTNFQTDLPVFLKEYISLDDDKLYHASLRHQLKKSDVIHWENSNESIVANLDNIIRDYLTIDIIPCIMVNKKPCQPNQLPAFLMDSISLKIKVFKKEGEPSQDKNKNTELLLLLSILSKLRIAISDIIRINNLYYQPVKSSDLKGPDSYIIKLDELKMSLISSEAISESEVKKESTYKKSLRRSAHFLDRHSIFKSGKGSSDSLDADCSAEVVTQREPVNLG